MILRSSSLDRPVFTSASTPRSLKMAIAAGLSLSAMSTRGMDLSLRMGAGRALRRRVPCRGDVGVAQGEPESGGLEFGGDGREGPVEPGRDRVEVRGLDRGAAP